MSDDERWLRHSFRLAEQSVEAGDSSFGCVIVDREGRVLAEGQQTVVRSGDWLAHAEMNALKALSTTTRREALAGATLYSSTEPCPMCSGAIGWSVSRLVYGLSQAAMYRNFSVAGEQPRYIEPWSCRSILEHLHPPMTVIGPILEDEGNEAHLLWMRMRGHPSG